MWKSNSAARLKKTIAKRVAKMKLGALPKIHKQAK
jgi:hypothetical protein